MRNFVTPKVAEFRKIPRNSMNSVIWNSAEFRAIPNIIWNIRNFKKHTEFRIKMLCRKGKTQFVKQERNTQNSIALLNYLKRICAATILQNESFHQNFLLQFHLQANCAFLRIWTLAPQILKRRKQPSRYQNLFIYEKLIILNPFIKVAIKVASKSLKRKERNCAFKHQSLRCGATKKACGLADFALQRNMPNSVRTECYWTETDSRTYVISLRRAESDILSNIGLNWLSRSDTRILECQSQKFMSMSIPFPMARPIFMFQVHATWPLICFH